MNADAPRALAYCRQSEARSGELTAADSLSLRSQEDQFRRWCERTGAVPVAVIADHDLRGADPERPGIRQLLETVQGQRVNVVWLLSLSRLARDLILQLVICRDLERAGVTLYSETEGGIDDPFIRGIMGLMHEKSTRQTSAHLKGAFARRARDGGFPVGPTPIGFARPHRIMIHRANGTSYERETGEPSIDEEMAPLVRNIFDRFDRGDSLHAIADDLARQGSGPRGGTWTRRTVRRILESPIYAGDIVHHGEVVAHNDAWAIVSRDQWERVQTRLTRVVVLRNDTPGHWLAGLVEHGCGARMYYAPDARANTGQYGCRSAWELPATRCTIERRHIGAPILTRIVRHLLTRDFAGRRAPSAAHAYATELAGGVPAKRARIAQERRLHDAEARWSRAYERFVAGKLTSDMMDAEDVSLATARTDHASAITALPVMPDVERIARASATLDTVAALIADATDAELRPILASLGVVIVDASGVSIRYHPEFATLFDSAPVAVPRYGKGWR